jgi:hypothetical protein
MLLLMVNWVITMILDIKLQAMTMNLQLDYVQYIIRNKKCFKLSVSQ